MRHAGAEMTAMKLRSLYSSLEPGSLVHHAGPGREALESDGRQKEQAEGVGKCFSCGFCGKSETRLGKHI